MRMVIFHSPSLEGSEVAGRGGRGRPWGFSDGVDCRGRREVVSRELAFQDNKAYVYICIYIYICLSRLYAYIHPISLHMYVCYVGMYVRTYVRMYVCMYVCMFACMHAYVCLFVCLAVCM